MNADITGVTIGVVENGQLEVRPTVVLRIDAQDVKTNHDKRVVALKAVSQFAKEFGFNITEPSRRSTED